MENSKNLRRQKEKRKNTEKFQSLLFSMEEGKKLFGWNGRARRTRKENPMEYKNKEMKSSFEKTLNDLNL